jgi:hypothetical protein
MPRGEGDAAVELEWVVEKDGSGFERDGSLPVPPYNAYRPPAFYRVDFRLEKRWRLLAGSIAFVLEGQNVTRSKRVSGLAMDCEGQGSPQCETTTSEHFDDRLDHHPRRRRRGGFLKFFLSPMKDSPAPREDE